MIFDAEIGRRLKATRSLDCQKHKYVEPRLRRRHRALNPPCTCIKQIDMAGKLGVSQQRLSQIESGKGRHVNVSYRVFKSAIGKYHDYVLFGTGREIHERFRYLVNKNGAYSHTHLSPEER